MKTRFKINSVRGKVFLAIIVVAFVGELVGGLIVSRVVEQKITHNYEVARGTTVESLSYSLPPMLESYDYELVERVITPILKHRYIASIAVYADSGTLIRSVEEGTAASTTIHSEAYALSSDGGVIGSLEIGFYTGYISDQARAATLALAFGLAGVFVLAVLVLLMLFDRLVSQPLSVLNKRVTEMTPENLMARIQQIRDDEFGTLAKNINGTAERLQEYDASRKEVEEELRESQETLYRIFSSMTDGIVVLDLNGTVTDLNDATLKLGRFDSADNLVGRSSLEIVDPNDRERASADMQQLARRGTVGIGEYVLIRADGSQYPADVTANALKDAGGNVVGFVSIIRDVTERKRTEEMLQQSEERFRTVFEYAPDAYYLNDLEGNLIDGNKAAERLSGYNKEELTGENFLTLNMLPPQDIPRAVEALMKNASGQPTGPDEFSLIRKDGSQVITEISTFPVEIRGQALVLAIARDITERRQMEEQLIITDRLASVGELASGIAHELNNPLTGVIGLSQLLLERNIPEEIKEDLKLVNSEAQRAASVVRGLLTFARKHPPARQLINVNEVIGKVLDLRTYEQRVTNIERVTNLSPDLPQIWADYFQLQQVFLNIVTNAEHFMREAHNKGTLTITTERIEDSVRISFSDDGPGISEKDLGHVFDPFFTTKEVGKGTGLGLSISHGIVTAHGGRIYAESEQDKGASFIVELPIRAEERLYAKPH